jgi:hypothetical protein
LRECGGDQDERDEDAESHGKIVAGHGRDRRRPGTENLKSEILTTKGTQAYEGKA